MGKKMGHINKQPGAYSTLHEQAAADYFARKGFDVMFLAPVRLPHRKTPDLRMEGVDWEIKSPTGNGSRTIENILRSSKYQSRYIILDLRFTKRTDLQAIAEAQLFFKFAQKISRMHIVKKNRTHITLER